MTYRVLQGDARTMLRELPADSVHCVVTSPPYWGLRDYGVAGQLGLEATPDEYVAAMVEVFREVRRVLRLNGTLWLNLGDSYQTTSGGGQQVKQTNTGAGRAADRQPARVTGLKPKDLIGIPWRVAFALQADGWWLRSDIVWAKPNPMPESVRDRPTKAHEYLFLLTPSERYFFDRDAVREPHQMRPQRRPAGRPEDAIPRPNGKSKQTWSTAARDEPGVDGHPAGRNLRSVWTIATQPYPEAHFATFPERLVEPCIKAGTSERGCCPECGAPWRRVRGEAVRVEGRVSGNLGRHLNHQNDRGGFGTHIPWEPTAAATVRWEPTCTHDADPVPCTVLDPFAGSGTVLAVAERLGRDAVGAELQRDFLPLIQRRVAAAMAKPVQGELAV